MTVNALHDTPPAGDAVVMVADDLTGAADAAIHFIPSAGDMLLLDMERPVPEGIQAGTSGFALNTASRNLEEREAVRLVTRATEFLSSLSLRLIYKKMDSQLRGRPGLEVETLRKGLGLACAFVAPAYPEQGRTTRDAIHLVHGVPVAEGEAGKDPVTPVTRSSLPELIADQAGVKTSHIYLKDLNQGMEEVYRKIGAFMKQGVRVITFDSVSREHLDMVARLGLERFPGTLLAGSAGLALSAAALINTDSLRTPPALPRCRSLLFVCGSASRVLHQQADALVSTGVCGEVSIGPESLTDADRWKALRNEAQEAWARGDLLIRISAEPMALRAMGTDELLSRLAVLVRGLLESKAMEGIFLSGGDTARKVLSETNARAIRIKGQACPGMAWGVAEGGTLAGVLTVTKAGAFGREEDLVRLYRMLKGAADTHG
jgi:D-threonate/D-erythronate kinase